MIAFHSHRNIFTVNWKPANQTTRKWNSFAFRNVESLWNSLYIFSKLYQNNNISIHFLIHFCNIHNTWGLSWTLAILVLKWCLLEKVRLQKEQVKGLAFSWTASRTWLVITHFIENLLSQVGQAYGFFSSWTGWMCFFNIWFFRKRFPHIVHKDLFNCLWTLSINMSFNVTFNFKPETT